MLVVVLVFYSVFFVLAFLSLSRSFHVAEIFFIFLFFLFVLNSLACAFFSSHVILSFFCLFFIVIDFFFFCDVLILEPHSFTGEDVVELHVHGGRAVIHDTLVVRVKIRGRDAAGLRTEERRREEVRGGEEKSKERRKRR